MRSRTCLALALVGLLACSPEAPIIAPEPMSPEPMSPEPAPLIPVPDERHLGSLEMREPPRPLASECSPGETRSCGSPAGRSPNPNKELRMACRSAGEGVWRFSTSDCSTPLVVAFDERPVAFTRAPGTFALGAFARTEWVSERTPWLALDRDGSGCVEDVRELFGPPASTPSATGFESLAELDDTRDGRLDGRDAAFARLGLWFDRDQDRRCTPGELESLSQAGVVAFELSYTRLPGAVGSYEGAVARLTFRDADGHAREGRVVDVFLAAMDP